ncbi:hypothetical protein [Streptomyces silvisoli]|uniref:Fe/B12 periplasmic-binding domain-containing protein n=1 Tax=Streptomyces silvisoli TaxID=3034235 RepID=A0ABT5ZVS7_9ACTN|nr:hypothetical protein [Streptomyces silvisoli]MDF3293930.1 hypothetical protein [Streptomyces silvisoli]
MQDLGLNVVIPPEGESVFAQKLSWEEADRYPCDLIMLDTRTSSLQLGQLRGNSVWRALPAVRADQIGAWNPEPTLSYGAMARVYDSLATCLSRARPLTTR